MLKEYFTIIRKALSENREKGAYIYYESHHIVPKSFSKKSTTVLLTPEEHYKAHRYLAESFKDHPEYSQKMLWAFHRMTYSGDIELTEEEYAVARKALMKLWKRKKSDSHRKNIGKSHQGKKWMFNPDTNEHRQIDKSELDDYLTNGWINSHKFKKGWAPTEETRRRYSISATTSKLGKVGEQSRASKGVVVCENILTGEKIEAGSALQLAKKMNMNCSIFHEELNKAHYSNHPKPRTQISKYYQFLKEHKIYYKTQP